MTMLGRKKDTDSTPNQSNTANLNQDTATIITNHNPENSNQSIENDSKDLPF